MKKNKSDVEKKVEEIISKVRPYIQMHDGDVFLSDIEKDTVKLKVTGACSHCSLSDITYNKMLGDLIKEKVPQIKKIVIEN